MITNGSEDLWSHIVVFQRCMHAWEGEMKSLESEIKNLEAWQIY